MSQFKGWSNRSRSDSRSRTESNSGKKAAAMEIPPVTISEGNGETGGAGPVVSYKCENFFDFHGDANTDIWGPTFTKSLRKASEVFETMPFIPDSSVEKIGGAFVDENRSLRTVVKASSVDESAETDSGHRHTMSLSSGMGSAQVQRIEQLEKKVEELKAAQWKAPPIKEVIDRLLLGKPCSLSWYKSIDQKKQLLDEAVITGDGNCIMAVVLFIRKTVDQSILLNILDRCPVAAAQYANFLKQMRDWKELKMLYRRLNYYDGLGYFTLQECNLPELDKEEKIRLIKSGPIMFRNLRLKHEEDIQHVEDYSRLVHKQQKIEEAAGHGGDVVLREGSVLFTSVATTLLYCCRNHRGQERSTGNPDDLRKQFNISERQYFQMDLLALALNRDWKGVGSMLTSKGLLGFGKKKKSPIGFERVIRLLGQERYRAPDFVLIQYLAELDDMEVRYQLAMEVGMYDTALDCLKALKDRERVKSFINAVPVIKHYEFRPKVDALLSNSQIKWK